MDKIGPETLSRLIDEHGASLVLYAQQWCDGPEDVVQEAFIRLMRQRQAPDNIVGWLYRVVRNGAISHSRSTAMRTRHETACKHDGKQWFTFDYGDWLDAATAVAALQSLPMEHREVIVLRLWGGLAFEEIAELIGKSTSTAHRRYESALAEMRNNWSLSCPNQSIQQ